MSRIHAAMLAVGGFVGWLLGFIPRALRYALSLNARQIRALMCWGMLGGVAIEGLTVICFVLVSERFDRDLLKTVILYSEWLRIAMVGGVIAIAIQANRAKVRVGNSIDLETTMLGQGDA